jgi:hypothetical protein
VLFRIMEHGGHECALHATGTRPDQASLAGFVTSPGRWQGRGGLDCGSRPRCHWQRAGAARDRPPAAAPDTREVARAGPVPRLLARGQPERGSARPAASKQQPKTERAELRRGRRRPNLKPANATDSGPTSR